MFEGPVIGSLRICRKKAGGHLPALQMIANAITAHSLFGTGVIGAIAVFQILFLLTIHNNHSSDDWILTRIIHEASTAAADPGVSTALRSVGLLDVLSINH
jgi:hypothetical protein